MKSETGGVKVLMGFEQDTAGGGEAQLARPGHAPVLPSEAEGEQKLNSTNRHTYHSGTGACTAYVPRARRAHTISRVPAACRSSPQTTCSWERMERQAPFLAGCDGLTKAFSAHVVPCKGTSHGYAERALAHNVLSTGHQQVILQSDQEPSIFDPNRNRARRERAGDSNANGSIERANQTVQGQIRAIKDCTDRQIGATMSLDSSVLRWLVRHAAWTLTTFHVGGDGMTSHQRIGGKPFNQQIAAFGEQILFKPHTRPRDHNRNLL